MLPCRLKAMPLGYGCTSRYMLLLICCVLIRSTAAALASPVTNPPSSARPATGAMNLPCMALTNLTQGRNGIRDSPLATYSESFRSWLNTSTQQEAIAGVATLVGVLICWDGPAIWHFLFVSIIAAGGAAIVRFEDQSFFHLAVGKGEWVLLAEAAVVIGFAAHIGFEGSQVLLGVVIGIWGASETSFVASAMDHHFAGLGILWYTAGAVLGLIVLERCRRPVLSALSPLLGGLLVASGIGLLIGRGFALLATKMHPTPPQIHLVAKFFPSPHQSWVTGFTCLLGQKPLLSTAVQCCCALFGTSLYKICHPNKKGALFLLAAGIIASTVVVAMSMGCKPKCPASTPWRWLISGSILWLMFAMCSHSRHLRFITNEFCRVNNKENYNSDGYAKVSPGPSTSISTWDDLSQDEKTAAVTLGWDRQTIEMGGRPDSTSKIWNQLNYYEQDAAARLRWTQDAWDRAGRDGYIAMLPPSNARN